MEQESQMIQGTVLAVIYQNPENGYCVLKVRTEQGEAVTVVGVIPMCVVGERLAIVGRWTRHQSFGQQFEAEFLERLMPETTSEILAFLSSRAVKGIGPKMAEKIVSRFGEKSLNVLEQDPMQLTQIPGISEKKAQEMSESFQKQFGIRRLIEFLTIYHLPAQLAVRLYRAYGELAQEALRDDPYLLTDSYYRADFSQVDAFAIALGVSADDERRVEAGILFELSYNLGAGHTFIPQDKLRTATCALLDLDGEMIDAVSEQDAVWSPTPEKFEAGTQDAAGIYATGVALEYVERIGLSTMEDRERALMHYLADRMEALKFIEVVGPTDPDARCGAFSFNVTGVHPHDVSGILSGENVAIRAGHHCAQPLLLYLGMHTCCRASVAFYNDAHDIDRLIDGLELVGRMFNV